MRPDLYELIARTMNPRSDAPPTAKVPTLNLHGVALDMAVRDAVSSVAAARWEGTGKCSEPCVFIPFDYQADTIGVFTVIQSSPDSLIGRWVAIEDYNGHVGFVHTIQQMNTLPHPLGVSKAGSYGNTAYNPTDDWYVAGQLIDQFDIWLSSEHDYSTGVTTYYASCKPHADVGLSKCIVSGRNSKEAICRAVVMSIVGEYVDMPIQMVHHYKLDVNHPNADLVELDL